MVVWTPFGPYSTTESRHMPDDDAPPPIRSTTIKNFLKERSDLRVSVEAIELMVELLTTAAVSIADKAVEATVADDRSTLLGRDIQGAYDEFMREAGPPPGSPEGLHEAIGRISNEELTQLIKLIRDELRREGA